MESYMRSPNCYVAAFLIIQDFAHILTGSIRSCIYVCVHRAAMRFDVCKYVNGKPVKAVDAVKVFVTEVLPPARGDHAAEE